MRDPYYAEHVPADKKEIFASEGEYEAAKLEELKADIQASGLPVCPYERPSALAEAVQGELESYIDAQFPRDKRLSSIQSDRFRHLAYARAYTRIYLPNEVRYSACFSCVKLRI